MYIVVVCAVVFLAYFNGANDNFKGVATLFGSNTTNYKKAIWWATVTTFAGSVSAIFLAGLIVKNFSGKGLLPDDIINSVQFIIALSLGAALTVMIASKTGMPVSTTHSLIGGLIGCGLVSAASQLNLSKLSNAFLLPMLFSPVIAAVLSYTLYIVFRRVRIASNINKESCLCIGEEESIPELVIANNFTINNESVGKVKLKLGSNENCNEVYKGSFIGIQAQTLLNGLHFLSAGVVSFARGLNDTPKIVALMLIVPSMDLRSGLLITGVAMAVGGLISAGKVAETMSKKITPMNHGQGFTANLTTGILVILASFVSLPVSTTQVAVGSIMGIGAVTKKANVSVLKEILFSWVLTLPAAAAISAVIYLLLTKFI